MMPTCKKQNGVLLLASMVFYGWWSVPCLGLMVGTCVANYIFLQMMQKGNRRMWLALSLIVNFGVLGVFKYFNFFAENLKDVLKLVGMNADLPTLNIILPVGISFYTFQLSAYMVDCYRQKDFRQVSLLKFLTFISFFPQLVAGPIERGESLLPQFSRKRNFSDVQAREGMRLILWGLMKKMLIADNCALQVDYAFSNYDSASLPTLWMGALYFTFQIYGDFSGYSDMAVGSAKLLGIEITRNFNRPYLAKSMQDFWRRWHITLMGWFKDYVYIPLGGNRKGETRKRLNNLTVFLLSGLWHGSNWTFVMWGAYHALIYYLPVKRLAFLFVMIGWVIFRAPDMTVAMEYIHGMFNPMQWGANGCSRMPLVFILLLVLTEWRMRDEMAHPFQWKSRGWQSLQAVRLTTYFLLFIVVILLGGSQTQFIYFQF